MPQTTKTFWFRFVVHIVCNNLIYKFFKIVVDEVMQYLNLTQLVSTVDSI